MSSKIQRNESCPCGSGVKYKKCCLTKSKVNSKITNKTLEFIKKNKTSKILNLLIEAQLNPQNHGKNFRIEELAKLVFLNINANENFDFANFQSLLSKDYGSSSMEDNPENLFCEQVVFYGGNFNLFSGISAFAIEIFRTLSDVIFNIKNNLSQEFKDSVYQGIRLILEIGQIYANSVGTSGNVIGIADDSEIIFRAEEYDFGISEESLIEICKRVGISTDSINYFIAESDDSRFNLNIPDLCPLLFHPFVKIDGYYYFLLISNQANCLNEFILNSSINFDCKDSLLKLYHSNNWNDVGLSLHKMNWMQTDIEIPSKGLKDHITEGVFRFDTNRLAYVCYVRHSDVHNVYHKEKNTLISSSVLNKRLKEVIEHLEDYDDNKFLTLILFSGLGRDLFLPFDQPIENEERVAFSIYNFINLINCENWEINSLYKFARSYSKFNSKTIFPSSSLDMYAVYKAKGEQFYLSDDSKSDYFFVVPGEGSRLIQQGKMRRDYHGALAPLNDTLVYIPVFKKEIYAPIYSPERPLQHFFVMLNSFEFPLWISNYQNKNDYVTDRVASFANAICYWLNNLESAISITLNENIKNPLELELEFNERIFEAFTTGEILNANDDSVYQYSISGNKILLKISTSALKTFIGDNNKGERNLIMAILKSLNLIKGVSFSNEAIIDFLDEYVPLGQKKMILYSDSQNNLLTDNRWLSPLLYISEAEKNIFTDELPTIIEKAGYKIPKNINEKEEKIKLFNLIVTTSLGELSRDINRFDNSSLLFFLMRIHEHLIWKREYNKIIIPAQVLCFSHIEEKINEINTNHLKIISTTVSVRCLIEYVSARPSSGEISVGYDDVDILLARMNQIVNYGFLSDSVNLGMDNPKVGLLDSGRLGVSKEFFDDIISKFSDANINEEIDGYLENFSEKFKIVNDYDKIQQELDNDAHVDDDDDDDEFTDIDEAFKKDWGISYLNIYKFCYISAKICAEEEKSVIQMPENSFKKLILEQLEISEEELDLVINKFILSERTTYLTAPEGYKNSEIFPWKYNREFSLTRRFIIRHNDQGIDFVIWGFRNAIAVQRQLDYLLFNGKLKNGGKSIDKILGKFRVKKGSLFRTQVKDWLKTFKQLTVLDYEIVMSKRGHLKSEIPLGDVDIMVFDKSSKILLSLECKDTDKAKNIHEMKSEMDNYLGRTKGKGMIQKHLKRHNWLFNNQNEVCSFLKIENIKEIRSFMITSEIIPTVYIKAEELPMPIIAFTELTKGGISQLLD